MHCNHSGHTLYNFTYIIVYINFSFKWIMNQRTTHLFEGTYTYMPKLHTCIGIYTYMSVNIFTQIIYLDCPIQANIHSCCYACLNLTLLAPSNRANVAPCILVHVYCTSTSSCIKQGLTNDNCSKTGSWKQGQALWALPDILMNNMI